MARIHFTRFGDRFYLDAPQQELVELLGWCDAPCAPIDNTITDHEPSEKMNAYIDSRRQDWKYDKAKREVKIVWE
jgi:hypothetical protein